MYDCNVGCAFIGVANDGDGAALADGAARCFLLAGELSASANGVATSDIVVFEEDGVGAVLDTGLSLRGVVFGGVRLRFAATGSFARRIRAALMSMLLPLLSRQRQRWLCKEYSINASDEICKCGVRHSETRKCSRDSTIR